MVAGSHPSHFTLCLDDTITHQGARAATIQANEAPEDFSTLMQQFKADTYRGQRLRLSANVRAEAVEGWAGLWMRVDGPAGQFLAFDNMQRRPLQGTLDWSQQSVVLDVPEQGELISIGILLDGPGQVWMAGVGVEVVGPEVATTPHHGLPDHPVNLAFAAEE